jgi:hypothetical protein
VHDGPCKFLPDRVSASVVDVPLQGRTCSTTLNSVGEERRDFFISYTSADKTWAEWIAWELEAAGYRVLIQAWDFRPGMNFVTAMQKGATDSSRTLIVLSAQFFESNFTEAEWTSAFAKDPAGKLGLLIPVRVVECEPAGLLHARIYIDLVGLDEEAARKELLDGVKDGRVKPTKAPLFPGSIKPKPAFPATRMESEGQTKGGALQQTQATPVATFNDVPDLASPNSTLETADSDSPCKEEPHAKEMKSVTSEGDETPLSWRRAVVRVWCGFPREKGQFLGNAFFVSSDKLLTAFAVVNNCQTELMLEGPGLDGGLRRVTEVHPHPSIDAAMLIAPTGLASPPELWIPWQEDIEQGLARGGKLTLIGYRSDDMVIELITAFVRDEDDTTGSVMLSGPLATRMTGAPVFSGVRLVGIALAHNSKTGDCHVMPITRVRGLFSQFGIAPVAPTIVQHLLQEYPLFVPFGVERLNPSLWKGYARIIPLDEEIEVIYKANQERLAADPNLDEAFLLNVAQLPDPAQNRVFFWQVTFQTALRRSGRMLAALLLAVDENQLPPDCASARRELLQALRREAKK